MRKLEQKYAGELIVIGVHSAKFPNEKDKNNLYKAVKRYELAHPVVNDAEFQVWREYACRAWPTLMFIDPEGKVIGKHEGEMSFEDFDKLVGRMVLEFDGRGLLNREPINFTVDREPETALSFPGKLLADAAGNRLFIADSNHNRIVVTDLEGSVKQVIGSGEEGLVDGSFAEAAFNHPQGMALVGEDLYLADTENHALRRIDMAAGTVTTPSGNGNQGTRRSGSGPALGMELNSPWDLVHHDNKLYIAMAGSHQLWMMNLADGDIGPYAGSGVESIADGQLSGATLAQPSGITTDGDRLYFADSETSAIRSAELDPKGRVRTIVGLDLFIFGDVDGEGHHVRLQHPLGVAMKDGLIYVADTYNHKIKRISPIARSASTILGSGVSGYQDGSGVDAMFSEPSGLSFANGKLYIADTNNHQIRVADLDTTVVTTLEIIGL